MHQNQEYNKMNYSNEIIEKFFNNIIYPGNDEDCWLWNMSHGSDGYARFSFRGKSLRASRFIFECYNGPLLVGEIVRHKICDNVGCINPHHLLKGVQFDNMQDKVEHDRVPKGSDHWNSNLTEEIVDNIIMGCLSGKIKCMSDIEKEYKTYRKLVYEILSRRNWKHITEKYSDDQLLKISNMLNERPLEGNEDKIKDIKKRLQNGEQINSIAKLYKLSTSTISAIKHGRRYNNI